MHEMHSQQQPTINKAVARKKRTKPKIKINEVGRLRSASVQSAVFEPQVIFFFSQKIS